MSAAGLDRRLHAFRDDLADRRLADRVAAARFVDGEPRQVTAASAPVRSAPRADAALDTEVLLGELVLVFEERDGWAWVQLEDDGYVGYVPAAALGPRGAPATHRVTALRTFIFPEPSIKAPPVALVSMGARLAVAREEGKLLKLADGGYVSARHAEPIASSSCDPVAVAGRFLGAPYLWGGKTSLGLDCSGLLQVAMHSAGRACPRDSDMQRAALGRPCPADLDGSSLKRGDILFWKGHVGLVCAPLRLLHANAHHMEVVEEPLGPAIERIAAGGTPLLALGHVATTEP
jgi:cell wall-associated NlpC family hydrolase